MTESLRGRLLVAAPMLTADTFSRSVVLLLDHNDEGALGVVINRPAGTPLLDILPRVADLGSDPPVVFTGGPVQQSAAIGVGLVAAGAPPEGWRPVVQPFVTVDLDHDPALLSAALRGLRVFAGYAGWSAGQLEGEIEQGAWYVVDPLPSDPFHPRPEQLWTAVLRRQPWPLSAVATCPLDPSLN